MAARRGSGNRRIGTAGHLAEGANPLDVIVAEHALQLRLCDALEHIADNLPGRIDCRLIDEAAGILAGGLAGHFSLEEDVLFPLLRERISDDPAITAVLGQVEKEHQRDEDLSRELAEELQAVADSGCVRNAEMLGYMLRGYFEALRRHIEWEEALIIPAARRYLDERDLTAIAAHRQATI